MLALIALLALAAPPCPCGLNAACADARCESHGGAGACMCRFPAPKFSSAVYASVPAPKFKGEAKPVVKESHADCECAACQCAVCDGGCGTATSIRTEEQLRAAVMGGKVVTIYVGQDAPKGAKNSHRFYTLFGETSGVFLCFPGDDGEPKYQRIDVPTVKAAPAPTKAEGTKTAMVRGHEHKCNSCGTVWAHADNSANASHNCPKCGRTQMVQHRDVMVPVASKREPKVESQPFIPLQSYFPAASGCANGNCPTAPTTRRGWFR